MSLEVFPPLLFFGRLWERLVLIFWMFGRIHQWSHLVLDFCFVGWFLITDSISLLVIDLFRFPFLLLFLAIPACGISVPWPGIESVPLYWKCGVLATGPPGKSPDFLFLCDLVLVGFMFLEIYPFLLGCPICWCVMVHSSLWWSFAFLWYQL